MISEDVLEGVRVGMLTDKQLKEAIEHYTNLERDLKCHGERYHLVWKDVYMTLIALNGYKESRTKNKK
jgi:hypothetical protein